MTVIGDFGEKHIIHALEDLGTLAGMLPPALTTCEGMQDDFKKIEEWAQIFKTPAKLLERAGKNALLEIVPIVKDVNAVSADWTAGEYFKSGEASADFLTKLLTPGLPASIIPQFISGFLVEFVKAENLNNLEACYAGTKPLEAEIEVAIKDFQKGGDVNKARAILALKKVVSELPAELETCKGISKDLAAIKEWAQVFSSKSKLVAKITKNLAIHHKAIEADIASVKSDYAAKDYHSTGKDVADLLAVAIGPIEQPALLWLQ